MYQSEDVARYCSGTYFCLSVKVFREWRIVDAGGFHPRWFASSQVFLVFRTNCLQEIQHVVCQHCFCVARCPLVSACKCRTILCSDCSAVAKHCLHTDTFSQCAATQWDISNLKSVCMAGSCRWTGLFGVEGGQLARHILYAHEAFVPPVVTHSGARGSYSKFSNVVKQVLVEYAKTHSVEETLRTPLGAHVKRSTLRSWIDGVGNTGMTAKQNRPSDADRTALGAELEHELFEHIVAKRQMLTFVSVEYIQSRARALGPQGFRASRHWVSNFLSRNGLSLHTPTFRKKISAARSVPQVQHLHTQIQLFISTVAAIRTQHAIPLSLVFNFDELRLASQAFLQSVVDIVGLDRAEVREEVIVVQSRFQGSFQNATLILTGCADGNMLKPFIIFKGRVLDKLKINAAGVSVDCTSSSWNNHRIMRTFLNSTFGHVPRDRTVRFCSLLTGHCLIIGDQVKFHAHATVRAWFRDNLPLAHYVLVPKGCTPYVQVFLPLLISPAN